MKWTYPLLFLAGLLASCGKVKDPEFRRIQDFKLKNIDFSQVTVGFNVTYFNPNKFKVSVKEAVADVYVDSIYVGKFRQDSMVHVGENAEFSIPLTGAIPTATALKMDFKDIDTRELLVQAGGTVKVGKAGVFVNKDFNYSGRHKMSDLKIGDVLGH